MSLSTPEVELAPAGVREEASPRRHDGIGRRLATAAALLLIAAICVGQALALNFISDDAFITFRYARNLARGDGLTYNPGERVEGYTNFLEVVLLAALHRTAKIDLVTAGRGLSLLSAVAGVVLAWMLARRSLRRFPALALIAAALVAVNPYFAAWAGAGLESTLFAALLGASLLPILGAPITRARFLGASALALLLGLTRPEGVALYVVLAGCAAANAPSGSRVRVLWPGLAFFSALGAIYFVGRWLYFGDLLPNTFYAKSAFTAVHFGRGLDYILGYGANAFVWFSLPLVIAGVWVSLRRRLLLLAVMPLAVLLCVAAEGGDGLPMYRFMVPAIPLLAVLAALGCEALTESLGARFGLAIGIALAGGALALSFNPKRDSYYDNFIYQRDYEVPMWTAAGKTLNRIYPPSTKLATVPIGAVGYYSELPVIDMAGLTDRTIARAEVTRERGGWSGHEKHNGAYVLSKRPELLLLGNIYVDANPTLPYGVFPPYTNRNIVARERDLVTHPDFEAYYEMRHVQVAPNRWLHFFARLDVTP